MRSYKKIFIILAWVMVAFLAIQLRTAGLYRGLATEGIYHPDEPKQVLALWRYMHGDYVWRVGNLFYDGYPYGLNHFDEWILRPVLAIKNLVVMYLAPDSVPVAKPLPSKLFYMARSLRVVYGLLAAILCLVAARRLCFSRKSLWHAGLLLALAPISIAVSHSATGDIGTDLFAALMLLFLCMNSLRHRDIWIFLAGISVGMAFACKYNGLLCGGAVGIYLALRFLSSRNWKQFLISCGILIPGVLIGIVALTPALVMEWGQTSRDIYANFEFIREYGAGEWWQDYSALQKILHILRNNVPAILGRIGWFVMISAAIGLYFSGKSVIGVFKSKNDHNVSNADLICFSVISYPFIALVLSLAGKPEVQPFHFSYIQLPLVIACAYGIGQLSRRSLGSATRVLVVLLLFGSVVELGMEAKKDQFFWVRGDTAFIKHSMPEYIFTDEGRPLGKSEFLRDIKLEPENASIFRNSKKEIEVDGGTFWREVQAAPVPSVPFPGVCDWIFSDGPVFPRNERMFEIKRDLQIEKYIVFHSEPTEFHLGLRAGALPVDVHVNVGSAKNSVRLAPGCQELISVKPEKWKKLRARRENELDVYLVRLTAEALVGDAYLTVCFQDRELAAFSTFGGTPVKGILPAGMDSGVICSEVNRTRFIEQKDGKSYLLDPEDEDTSVCFFPPRKPREVTSIPLPSGVYIMECDVIVESEQAEMKLHLDDTSQTGALRQGEKIIKIEKGQGVLRYEFSKKFVPYQCFIQMTGIKGRVKIGDWRIRPHTERILEDLDAFEKVGKRAEWMYSGLIDRETEAVGRPVDVLFGKAFKLNRIELPNGLKQGEPLSLHVDMELVKYPFEYFPDYFIFVHVLDANGDQVFAGGCTIYEAITNSGIGAPIFCGTPENLKPGEYTVEMGVWSGRTRKRMSVSGPDVESTDSKRKKLRLGKLKVKG